MSEKLNDCNTVPLEQSVGQEGVATSDRLVFLSNLPLVPIYAEILPDGLIEDEI